MRETFAGNFGSRVFAGDCCGRPSGEFCWRFLQETFAGEFCRRVLLDLSQLAATSSHNYNSKIECTDFDSPNLSGVVCGTFFRETFA